MLSSYVQLFYVDRSAPCLRLSPTQGAHVDSSLYALHPLYALHRPVNQVYTRKYLLFWNITIRRIPNAMFAASNLIGGPMYFDVYMLLRRF